MPVYTVMFGHSGPSRYALPSDAIGSIRPKIRFLIAGQSTESTVILTPSTPPSRAPSARSAGYTYIFVGMQPTFTQVPPNLPCSTIAMSR